MARRSEQRAEEGPVRRSRAGRRFVRASGPRMAVMAGFVVALAGCSNPAGGELPQGRKVGRVEETRGDVRLKNEGWNDWRRVRGEDPVHEDDRVRTAPGSSAVLALGEGNRIRMSGGALVFVKPPKGLDELSLQLESGTLNVELGGEGDGMAIDLGGAVVRSRRSVDFIDYGRTGTEKNSETP